ncbi:MAG: hypothetical protein KDA24_28700, partial [Deltaproteobacteria bacterium]|nr:hypothetical protein [Deltaproteobacteria bacterium]
ADLADAARSCGAETIALWALVENEGENASGALPAQALLQLGEEAEEISESGRAHVLWAPPVRADRRALGVQIDEGPRSAGDAAIRVTTDGTVLPARGSAPAGTLGGTPWETIWQHAAFRTLREELSVDHRCARCPDLALCSTECPLDASMWAGRTS